MVRTLDADGYAFARLLAKSADHGLREIGWAALADAVVAKVGPKGYIHGWIYVGPQAVGARVFHAGHGHGTVTHHDGHQVRVKFDDGHKSTFSAHHRPDSSPRLVEQHSSLTSDDFTRITPDEAQAMQNHRPRWSAAERRALGTYSTSEFRHVNGHLRTGEPAPARVRHLVDTVDGTMVPSDRPILVSRGTDLAGLGLGNGAKPAELRALVGSTMEDKGFMSTTVDPKMTFGGDVQLDIEAPPGTPMAFIASASNYRKEQEMLLGRGLRYKVLSVKDRGRGKHPRYVARVRVVK